MRLPYDLIKTIGTRCIQRWCKYTTTITIITTTFHPVRIAVAVYVQIIVQFEQIITINFDNGSCFTQNSHIPTSVDCTNII